MMTVNDVIIPQILRLFSRVGNLFHLFGFLPPPPLQILDFFQGIEIFPDFENDGS